MFYECTECGMLSREGPERHDRNTVRRCPQCDARTRWEPAFEGEGDF